MTKILTHSQSIVTLCDSTIYFLLYVIKSEKYKNKKIVVCSNYLCTSKELRFRIMTLINSHINQHSKINLYLRFKIDRVCERVFLEAFGSVILADHPNSHNL